MMTLMGWTLPMTVLLGLGLAACGGETIHPVVTSTVPFTVVETTTTLKVVSSAPTTASPSTSIATTSTTIAWQPFTLTQAEAIAVEVDHHGGEAYRILGRRGKVTPEGLAELELSAGRIQLKTESRGYETASPSEFRDWKDLHRRIESIYDQGTNCVSVVVEDTGRPALQLYERTDRWRSVLFIPATAIRKDQKGISCALLSEPEPPLS